MERHKTVNLELRVDKPDNVYRYVHGWRPVPSNEAEDVYYLLIHAIVQWEQLTNVREVFTIVMQYSRETGRSVDVSQPPHILKEDLHRVMEELHSFIREELGTDLRTG